MTSIGNLLRDLPDARSSEITETLVAASTVRVERIVSLGQASPPGFWYDQPEAEWVLLLAGTARLRFADEVDARHLGPGDYLHIAAHRRHRVEFDRSDDPDRLARRILRSERIVAAFRRGNHNPAAVTSASRNTRAI